MKFLSKLFASGMFAALAVTMSPAAMASSSASSAANSAANSAKSAQSAATQIGKKQLKQFAATYSDLSKTQAKYMSKLKSAKNKADKAKVRQKAQKVMTSMIKKHDMTVQKYRQTAIAISKSPQLQKQLKSIMASSQ